MKRTLKILLGIAAGLAVLILLAVVILPWVIDPNDYRDDIERVVEQRTGRELAIDGRIELSVFPWLGAEVGRVTLGNAPGFGPAPFARVATADVRVRLLPLIRGNLRVGKVVLHEAEVNLARDAEGRTNWADLTAEADNGEAQGDTTDEPAPQGDSGGGLDGLTLGGLEVRQSRITWDDGATGARYAAADLHLSGGPVAPGEPFAVELRTRITSTAPELSGSIRLEGRATAEPAAARYRMEVAELTTDLTGSGLPAEALKATLTGELRADMGADEAAVEDLDLRAYGTRLRGNLAATEISGIPALEGRFQATAADGKGLAELLTAFAPGLQWQPQALAGSRLEGRIIGDLGPDSLALKDLAGSFLGLELTGSGEMRRPGAGAVASVDLHGRLADGEAALSPVAEKLPPDLQPQALEGAELDIHTRLDTGNNRARLTQLRLAALGATLTAEGTATGLDTNPEAAGRLNTEPFSPRRLLTDLGLEAPATSDPRVFRKAALDTAFRISPGAASLSDLTLTLDDSRLTGSAAMPRFDGPQLRFDLALDRLDADRYLPPASEDGSSGSGADTAAASSDSEGSPLPMDLLRRVAVAGDLSAGWLRLRDLRLSDLKARIEGSDGRFRIHPLEARLYQGRYAGDVHIDARGDTPRVTLDERLSGIDVGALLTDLTGKAAITGTADMAANLGFQGTSGEAILATLAGEGGYTLRQGAIAGIDLEQALTRAYAALGKADADGRADGTPFRELKGSATVDGGKIRSEDLSLRSSVLDAEGRGFVDLAKGRVDYRLDAVVGEDTARAIRELRGLAVPMRVRGPVTDPGVKVELEKALKQRAQESAEKELEKKKDELRDKARDLLNF